jgi:hypothetical protein
VICYLIKLSWNMCKCYGIEVAREESNLQVFAKHARIMNKIYIVELQDDKLVI